MSLAHQIEAHLRNGTYTASQLASMTGANQLDVIDAIMSLRHLGLVQDVTPRYSLPHHKTVASASPPVAAPLPATAL